MKVTLKFIRLNESNGQCELVTWFRKPTGEVVNTVESYVPTPSIYKVLMASQFRELIVNGKEFLRSEETLKLALV